MEAPLCDGGEDCLYAFHDIGVGIVCGRVGAHDVVRGHITVKKWVEVELGLVWSCGDDHRCKIAELA